jgi:hypothetical protein
MMMEQVNAIADLSQIGGNRIRKYLIIPSVPGVNGEAYP